MEQIEPWFGVEDIARHLGVSKETVYRWIERSKIPAHRIGKLWRFKPSEVDDWVRDGSATLSTSRKSKGLKSKLTK